MSMDRQRTAKGQVWEPHGLSPYASAKWPLLFSARMECQKFISLNGIFCCVWADWLTVADWYQCLHFSTTSATVIRAQMSFITQRLRLHLFNLLVVSMGFIVFKTVINGILNQCKPCFFIRDCFIGNLLDSSVMQSYAAFILRWNLYPRQAHYMKLNVASFTISSIAIAL